MKSLLTVAAVCLLASGVLSGQGTPQQAEAGRTLYNVKRCALCHTVEGKGGTLTKQFPLDGVGAKLSAADVKRWLTHPAEMEAKAKPTKPKMSSMTVPLTDEEADALTAYMMRLTEPRK